MLKTTNCVMSEAGGKKETDQSGSEATKKSPQTKKAVEMLSLPGVREAVISDGAPARDGNETDVDNYHLRASSDQKWEENFNKLLQFKESSGHCLVPNRYTKDPQLGAWVSTQRRLFKMGKSEDLGSKTRQRIERLTEIGFEWTTKDPRHVPWEERFRELTQFVNQYGHAQVPIGWEPNPKLANWVSTQRQEYKLLQKGRQSRLSVDRIEQLNQINFVWEAQRGGPRRSRRASACVPKTSNPVRSQFSSLQVPDPVFPGMGTGVEGVAAFQGAGALPGFPINPQGGLLPAMALQAQVHQACIQGQAMYHAYMMQSLQQNSNQAFVNQPQGSLNLSALKPEPLEGEGSHSALSPTKGNPPPSPALHQRQRSVDEGDDADDVGDNTNASASAAVEKPP